MKILIVGVQIVCVEWLEIPTRLFDHIMYFIDTSNVYRQIIPTTVIVFHTIHGTVLSVVRHSQCIDSPVC